MSIKFSCVTLRHMSFRPGDLPLYLGVSERQTPADYDTADRTISRHFVHLFSLPGQKKGCVRSDAPLLCGDRQYSPRLLRGGRGLYGYDNNQEIAEITWPCGALPAPWSWWPESCGPGCRSGRRPREPEWRRPDTSPGPDSACSARPQRAGSAAG